MRRLHWQYWIVLWPASYAHFPIGKPYWAASEKGALVKAIRQTEFGAFSCTRNNLLAVPAGANWQAALR